MKKILLIGCLLCANLQAQVYNFESAATGSGGISTATARQNTGWTSNGTTAQDTSATYYLINGKYQRLILVDTDNDSVIIAPHALFPLAGKDATSLLFAFDSTGRLGLNALTSAQARRAMFNVLGRAVNDTLVIWSNEGNTNATGDSVAFIAGTGIINAPAFSIIPATGYITIGGTNALNRPSGGNAVYLGPGFSFSGMGERAGLGSYFNSNVTGRWQGITTIRNTSVTSDTLLVVRNDWNSTLDSTMMVFANGDGYFGGNNLYIGGHRIRSNAAGDSLIFYEGSTMIAAILTNGSYVDLVAGTPPTLWRNGPPQEYIWLLRIVVLLLLLLIAFKVYDYAKPRIRKHKTLPGEI